MKTLIAVNRFGLGARAGDAISMAPRRWLLNQLERYEPRPSMWKSLPGSAELAGELRAARLSMRDESDDTRKDARRKQRRDARDTYRQAVDARIHAAITTDTPFVERLVHFWSNHFAISVDKLVVAPLAGAFEFEAIRPHVLGRFEDMLLAVERHPAMQLYLDQVQSVGPNSPLARRRNDRNGERKAGLNENLAREILELHTLGVRSGYSQEDVTEFARALTGWSFGGIGRRAEAEAAGQFMFRNALHEPGVRTIRGRRYAQEGEAQALAVLHDLAMAEATARHIATKLVRHFVADEPSPVLVNRLARVFDETHGDLPSVYRALVDAPESANPAARKFKTPWEWLISILRGIDVRDVGEMRSAAVLQQLGQAVWQPGSPAGFDDVAASWAGPDALVRRVEVAQRIAERIGDRFDPRTLGEALLHGGLGQSTARAIASAESRSTGLALLLVAPEFLRR
ncbi:DUF1800 domain-containing protein [Dokdonella sp.]|uniref:DUF1800 domain-containing protein n=1 Tax=Dokdonella sp. TaxID=2291710 RepID=UPI0025C1B848|nr:DUF1800 domain-containing protein [Dokdonella sp.]MBX3693310.1 DUF1800 domain-containing protein [Dokdonella sp.]MCW5568715.1 DUF1800 domain-containing protein [Dokdonella sp.]